LNISIFIDTILLILLLGERIVLDKERIESVTGDGAYYEQIVALALCELETQGLCGGVTWMRAAFARSKLAKRLDINDGIDMIVAHPDPAIKLALPIQVKVVASQVTKFYYLHPEHNIPVLITRSRRWYRLHRQDPFEAIRRRAIRQARLILTMASPELWQHEYYWYYRQIENACRVKSVA
jgi:hypothetical protein